MLSGVQLIGVSPEEILKAHQKFRSLQVQKDKAVITYRHQVTCYEQAKEALEEKQALAQLIHTKKQIIQFNKEIGQLKDKFNFPELDVSEQEWQQAKAFFEQYPHLTKLPRPKESHKNGDKVEALPEHYQPYQNGLKHSFIHVDGVIYAKKPGIPRGEGGEGNIKTIQNEAHESFVVKIEGRGLRNLEDSEILAMQRLDIYHGQGLRSYEDEALKHTYTQTEIEVDGEDEYEVEYEYEEVADFGKNFKGNWTEEKLYTVQEEEQGQDLFEHLYWAMKGMQKVSKESYETLSLTQKLIIAIQATHALETIHQNHIIHGDIKPENMMVLLKEQFCKLKYIDFNFAKISYQDQPILLKGAHGVMGSLQYCAPEIPADALIDLEVELDILEEQELDKQSYQEAFNAIQDKLEKLESLYSYASDIYALGKIFQDDLKLHDPIIAHMLQTSPSMRPGCQQILDSLYQALSKRDDLSVDTQKMLDLYRQKDEVEFTSIDLTEDIDEKAPLMLRMDASPPPITPMAKHRAQALLEDAPEVGCLTSLFSCLSIRNLFGR